MNDDDLIRRGDALYACQSLDPEGVILSIPPAALPVVSAPVAVRVKPLEWEPHWTGGREAREFAKTPIGLEYHVNDSGWWFPIDELRICADRAKAKAAAQQDYAARIMAAIDVVDVAELVAELTAERDRLAEANHRQAACINYTVAELGPDSSATIEGLPKAARHVVATLRAACKARGAE